MAKLYNYEQQVSTPTLRGVEQPRALTPPATQSIPEAIGKLSRGIGSVAEGLVAVDEAQAKAWTADALSKARLEWATHLRRRQEEAEPGAVGFTPKLIEEFDEYADAAIETAPTDTAKKFLKARLGEFRFEVAGKAMEFEATARVDYIEKAHNRGITNAEVLMNEDPSQYQVVLAEQVALIKSAAMGPAKKSKMIQEAIDRISGAAVWSQINDSPTAFLQSIGLYADKNGKVNGDLKGVTENVAFNALSFDDRIKYYESAITEKARVDREAEDAIAGRTVRSNDATLRRLYELLATDPLAAERFALDANRRGSLSQDDMKSGITKAREEARRRLPDSEYERSRNYIVQSLDPGPMVADPVKRQRLAEAMDRFDRWVLAGNRSDAEIQKEGRDIVRRYQFIDMSDTLLILPQPRYGQINRTDPAIVQQDVARVMRSLKDKLAKKEITQSEYDEDVEILNDWRKATGQ